MDEVSALDAARFRRIEELFHQASELDSAGRAQFLDGACAGDPDLRRRVEVLLAAADGAEARLDRVVHSNLQSLDGSEVPDRIGAYRVIEEIGRGGFATVYLAERDDAQFTMRVAIKVVRRSLGSDDVAHRLRRERQILAALHHPNIARVLDGGSAPDGSPFVVMEYIEGLPVDRYCEANGLSAGRCLTLFRTICEAVQYAHQNLVLHRDIKSSNILVTEDGVPKLLDFGIAKLLSDENSPTLSGADLSKADLAATLTRTGVRILTPEYASPEQVENRPLTTATDVYALGVLLYRLLVGERPYQFPSGRWADVERVICEQEPAPPSVVLRQRAGRDRGLFERYSRSRMDDLDTIVLKALRKEPERRYASVSQLSEDLRRYQEGLPILARKDTFGYRAAKFLQRHRTAVAVAAVVSLTLVTSTVVATRQAHEARRAREASEQEKARAVAIAQSMEDLFGITDPYHLPGQTVTARQILTEGARRIRLELSEEPEIRADLLAIMGRVHREMALYDEAEKLLGEALEIRRDLLGNEHPEIAESLRDLGVLFIERGDCEAAAEHLAGASGLHRRLSGEESLELAATLHYQGQWEMDCGDPQVAEERLQQALDNRRRALGAESEAVAATESLLAELWFQGGDYERAEDLLAEILERRRRTLGPDHPEVGTSLSNLAAVISSKGDPAAALELWEEALAIQKRFLGDEHLMVAQTLYNMAHANKRLRRSEEAENLLLQALGTIERVHGPEHPMAATCLHHLGDLLRRRGDATGAVEYFRRALDLRRRLFGEDHLKVAQTLIAMARLVAKRDVGEAESLYREALAIEERSLPEGDYRLSYPLIGLGSLRWGRGDTAGAESLFRRALELRRSGLPEDHWEVAIAEAFLGQCLADQERFAEAEELLTASHQRLLRSLGEGDTRTREAAGRLRELRAARASTADAPDTVAAVDGG